MPDAQIPGDYFYNIASAPGRAYAQRQLDDASLSKSAADTSLLQAEAARQQDEASYSAYAHARTQGLDAARDTFDANNPIQGPPPAGIPPDLTKPSPLPPSPLAPPAAGAGTGLPAGAPQGWVAPGTGLPPAGSGMPTTTDFGPGASSAGAPAMPSAGAPAAEPGFGNAPPFVSSGIGDRLRFAASQAFRMGDPVNYDKYALAARAADFTDRYNYGAQHTDIHALIAQANSTPESPMRISPLFDKDGAAQGYNIINLNPGGKPTRTQLTTAQMQQLAGYRYAMAVDPSRAIDGINGLDATLAKSFSDKLKQQLDIARSNHDAAYGSGMVNARSSMADARMTAAYGMQARADAEALRASSYPAPTKEFVDASGHALSYTQELGPDGQRHWVPLSLPPGTTLPKQARAPMITPEIALKQAPSWVGTPTGRVVNGVPEKYTLATAVRDIMALDPGRQAPGGIAVPSHINPAAAAAAARNPQAGLPSPNATVLPPGGLALPSTVTNPNRLGRYPQGQ